MAASRASTPADDRLVAPIYPVCDQMDTLLMIFSGFRGSQLTCVNAIWLTTDRKPWVDVAKPAARLDRAPQASLR